MLSWMRDLETANNVGDVLGLARQCVATLPASTVELLPTACRERELRDAQDVRWWSERLSEEYWRRRNLGFEVEAIQDLWSFFLRASIQTTRLATRAYSPAA